ncbi:hypothetical protein So717_26920 [Roseobacter cerasinus]|uniref:Uncharacterized protein n=2 Tax=Roseobacter cerasinus TaxID=2602289 RepID=A0A640VSE6_9RHOB|nr:hypothetical protein So717_26920 [Roseobacter cerasinus]
MDEVTIASVTVDASQAKVRSANNMVAETGLAWLENGLQEDFRNNLVGAGNGSEPMKVHVVVKDVAIPKNHLGGFVYLGFVLDTRLTMRYANTTIEAKLRTDLSPLKRFTDADAAREYMSDIYAERLLDGLKDRYARSALT